MKYFYEKRFYREDGQVYVKRYSRSFPINKEVPKYDELVGTNVSQASASRAKSRVRELAFSNPELDGLLTLTFRDIPTEEEAHRRFDLFRRAVARNYRAWHFLGVKELQKRGSIHFHLLVNFCPGQEPSPNNDRKLVSSLWSYGWSDYAPIKGDDKWRTELYLLKYLAKDKVKLFKTYYIRSRGLKDIEPRLFDTHEPIHPLAENVYVKKISNSFVDRFEILEYTYAIATNKGENINGISKHRID